MQFYFKYNGKTILTKHPCTRCLDHNMEKEDHFIMETNDFCIMNILERGVDVHDHKLCYPNTTRVVVSMSIRHGRLGRARETCRLGRA